MSKKVIAIIGGGFSGISVAYNLLNLSKKNQSIEIDIFDDEDFQNNGKAYQTRQIKHILNVPADKMGLPFENEKHFYEWLCKESKNAQQKIDKRHYTQESFVPRALYNSYLQETIVYLKKNSAINFSNKKINQIKFDGNFYSLQNQEGIDKNSIIRKYNYVVVACGLNKKELPANLQSDKIINNIWEFFNQKKLPKHGTVLVVGTGLTMVDASISLNDEGFAGKIIACSKNTRLPLPHSPSKTRPIKTLEALDAGLPLSKILHILKKASKENEWQSVIHGIRGITSQIWQNFDLNKKQRFLRHLMNLWNAHRHRVDKNNYNQITKMIEEGGLEVVKGRVINLEEMDNQRILATLNSGRKIEADLVLNAMGFDFLGKGNSLLESLLEEKIINIHPTNLGFEVNKNHPNFYLAGSLLTGKYLEITAVPELRVLSHQIALEII